MAVKIRIPNVLKNFTNGELEVYVEASNVKEMIDKLEENYKGIKERICDENGNIRRFINIFVNGEDIRFLELEKTKLKDGDEVSIIPAIAGGQ